MFVHFLLSLSNNVVIKLDAIDILHFLIVISRKISIRKRLRSICYKFLISKSRNVPFVEVGALHIDISEGIDGGIRDESVRNGSHSEFDIFVECSMWAVWIGPG